MRYPSRRGVRIVVRGALVLTAGVVAAALVGEAYLRFTTPFMTPSVPTVMVPGVGMIKQPNVEVRYTNRVDFWTTSRTNRYGFLDREPPDPERAARSCHVAFIGDSFVDAMEVPIEHKVQVRLEELAADQMPGLGLIATAFGHYGTGPIEQLAFYDHYARPLHPRLLVLVWNPNDLTDSSPVLRAALSGWDPDRFPGNTGVRRALDGEIELRPPHPEPAKLLSDSATATDPWLARALDGPSRASYLAAVLDFYMGIVAHRFSEDHTLARAMEAMSGRPWYRTALDGWQPTTRQHFSSVVGWNTLPPVFAEALEYAAFALEQFKERADRDGAEVVVLIAHYTKFWPPSMFDRIAALADTVGVPIIDHADYILRQGHELEDAQWAYDGHWNAAGHQWAAEAVLDYIKDSPEVCNDRRETAPWGTRRPLL